MFGTYRTLLAIGVVCSHLGLLWWYVAPQIVFGFYVLSGYLMTLIMHKNYGYTGSGMGYFALNRFLRLFPTYWVAILFSVALILIFGEAKTTAFHPAIYLPNDLVETAKNVFLVLTINDEPRLSPPAWALTVELFFYIAIGLGISRNRLITWIWFLCSALYPVFAFYNGYSWADRYYPLVAGSLPFATGALAYHYKPQLTALISFKSERINQYVPLLVATGLLANWIIGTQTGELRSSSMYVNIVFAALMVIALSDHNLLPNISRSLDKKIGDLSYPIYLLHMQAGVLAYAVLGRMGVYTHPQGPAVLAVGLIIVLIASWLLAILVGEPVNKLRELVKQLLLKARGQSPQQSPAQK